MAMGEDSVRRLLFGTLIVWTLTHWVATAQDMPSLLTGLLSTFATAKRNPGCPGECRHALSALFCSHVDEEADCGDPQLRCCTNPPLTEDDVHERPAGDADRRRPPAPDGGNHTFSRPPMLGQTSPISVGTNLTVRPGDARPTPSKAPGRPMMRPLRRRPTSAAPLVGNPSTRPTTSSAAPIPTAAALVVRPSEPPKSNVPCHGICVASLLASFCTRTSESSHCSPGESCCFTGAEEEPASSTMLSATSVALLPTAVAVTPNVLPSFTTTRRSPPAAARPTAASTTLPGATTRPSTVVATTVSPGTTPRPQSSTVVTRPPPTTAAVSRVPPRQPEDVDGVEECPGSCATGLLSLLCNHVDESVTCHNGGKCCVFQSSPEDETEAPTTKPPVRNCPGICLPSLLSGVCNRPAVLVPETLDCKDGTICCDNSLREGVLPSTTTTTSSPLLDMLSWPLKLGAGLTGHSDGTPNAAGDQPSSATSLIGQTLAGLLLNGAAAGLGGGGGGVAPSDDDEVQPLPPRSPPMGRPDFGPPPMPPPRPSQSHVDRMQGVPSMAPCPGTCIASFLKMNCFGSFQLDDSFACPKVNLVCCAPKTTAVASAYDATTDWNESFGHSPSSDSHVLAYTPRPVNKYVCGIKGNARPETPRVVGGRDASPGEWCWQVALINSLNQYLCGGALIGRQWVLTAAHCVTNLIRSGDAIYVRVGDYDLTSKYGSPGAQTLRVATTYIHHNHNSQTLDNNIALLKLEKPVELKEGVCLVCLPARGVAVEPGKRCTVTGYGYMGESGPIPLRIRKASLPIVSEQECVRKINSVTEKIFILPASSFCAGGEEGHDACQGDGGGPLSCEVDGYYEITGIVSWGFGCGRAEVPGIYVKVSSFIGWINQIISVNSI